MSNKQIVLDRLNTMGIEHKVYEHEAAHTMEDCYALPFSGPDVMFCKNILLCNRQKTEFYLYVMPADKHFRTADVSKLLGVSRLSFAPEECLMAMLQLQSGSLSPFGLWFDREHVITFVVDNEVKNAPSIAFHPCDNTATVIFRQDIFWNQVVPTFTNQRVELVVPRPAE